VTDRPLHITILSIFLVVAGMLVIGALWSGSEGGRAFAEAATSTYESEWLPWAAALLTVACGVAMLFAWPFSRWLLLIWMAWGVVEGLFLLDEEHYSLPVLAVYAAIVVVLFLPQSNEWFARRKAAA
jgi:hypothetical protein